MNNYYKNLAAIFLLLQSGLAYSLTIDFEEFPQTGTNDPVVSGEIGIKTFTFTGASNLPDYTGNTLGIDSSSFLPTTALVWCPSCTLTIENTAGDPFSLLSMDLAAAPISGGDITVTGYLDGGGTLETTLTLLEGQYTTFQLGAAWTGLEKVEFGPRPVFGAALDNLVVSPIPGAVWLFGSALAGLGWLRRRASV